MKKLFLAVHEHHEGVTTYLFRATQQPSVQKIVECFEINFEPYRDETIGVEQMDEPIDLDEMIGTGR